ncbi:hypothetical protein B0H13DRAFT_2354954 [Mycena leptocephala]|nr:hypothetical protein B0H13DRAFT_2354954 [Mycena leptocephala]
MAPKQKKTSSQGSRKAVPKNPRGKTVTGPADTDDFPGETLSLAELRSAAWAFFNNDACRRLVSLFAEVSIRECPPKAVANILREALPHVQEFIRVDPMVFAEHISLLYSISRAVRFAIVIHPKYIKEAEFIDMLNIYTPDLRKPRVQHNIQPATTAFVLPCIRMPEAESVFIPSDDEMDEAPSVVDVDDESIAGRDDEEEDELPAPKKLRHEVAVLQSSLPPQPVASSSKSRITPSPSKTQPVASSSKVTLSKMPVPYVAVPSSKHKRKRDPAISAYQPQPLPPPVPMPAAAPIQETPHTLRVDMLHEMLANPPGDWVRGNAQPLPATQLVPSSFVQDGLVPALYSQAPFKCHTCINSKKHCHFRGMNSSCEECHTGKHNCSIVANPTRFLQNIEELRPMMNLGPEVLSRTLLRAIELRRDCDFVYAQFARLTNRLELALDEVVLQFSNINDILPQGYVRFIFENPGDIQLLEGLSELHRFSATRPHLVLELQHLENNLTSDICTRRTPGDSTTTNEYYVPEEPPLMTNAPSYTDIPTISGHRASIFAGQPYIEPSAAEDRPGDLHSPLAPVPAASSQPHASPETYAVSPSTLVPSNAPSTVPTNTSAAGSVPTTTSAAYHSMSAARPFGTAGNLLHYPSEFSPGLSPGNHPLRQAVSMADSPSSPGHGGNSAPSGSGVA